MTTLFPFFRREVALPEIAGRAQKLDVCDVVGTPEVQGQNMVFVLPNNVKVCAAEIIRTVTMLDAPQGSDLDQRVTPDEFGAAMTVSATALMDLQERAVGLGPSSHALSDFGFVGLSMLARAPTDFFSVDFLVGADSGDGRLAVPKVGRRFLGTNCVGLLSADLGAALAVARKALFAFSHAFGQMAVNARNASVVAWKTLFAGLSAGCDQVFGHNEMLNIVRTPKSSVMLLGVDVANV